jgi:hypothetical protein
MTYYCVSSINPAERFNHPERNGAIQRPRQVHQERIW